MSMFAFTRPEALAFAIVLLKATLLLLVALGAATVLRRATAGSRHLVWLAALASVLTLPLLSKWAPLRVAVLPPQTSVTIDAAPPVQATPAVAAPRIAQPRAEPNSSRSLASLGMTTSPSLFARVASLPWWTIALGVWGIVAVVLLGWLATGAIAVRRIVRSASPLTSDDWMTPLFEVADRLDLEDAPRLLASDRIEMPFACGLITPTIVLPASARQWSDGLRRTVLFHELAHVRRRDLVGHTLGRLACAVYWFHPLVWEAAKRLRAESEKACDDLVLSCGARASDYAEQLLQMVLGVRKHGAPALAMPMARRKEFEGRVLAILDPAISRQGPRRLQVLAIVGGLAFLSLTIGAVRPVGQEIEGRRAEVEGQRSEVEGQRSKVEGVTSEQPRIAGAAVTSPIASVAEPRSSQGRQGNPGPQSSQGSQGAQPNPVAQLNVAVKMPLNLSKLFARAVGDTDSNGMRLSDGERRELLVRLLRTDPDADVRKTATWALANGRKDQATVSLMTQLLRSDKDGEVREMAAWALEGASSRDAQEALADALHDDEEEDVRETAAWALGNAGGDAALSALTAALRDRSSKVRGTAIWGVGTIEPKRAPAALVSALDDEDDDVRMFAAWALGQILDPGTGTAISEAFKHEKNSDVRKAELRALAFLGEQSKSVLDMALASDDAELRAHAVRILAGQGAGVWPWPWPWPRPRPSP